MDVNKLEAGLYALLDTSKGEILLALTYDKTPMTVANFVGLAEGPLNVGGQGKPYYDGLVFHRVIEDFMIQGGCPEGSGTGGPGYTFPDEIDDSLKHTSPGVLSMANAGPGTNGSQFFITHVATPWLDGKHTVFGKVVEGQDIVDTIAQGDTIKKVSILRKGAEAEAFTVSPESFAELVAKADERNKARLAGEQKKLDDEIRNRFPDAKTTASGLKYVVHKEGDGKRKPAWGQQVSVHYTGSLMDGRIFDSSIQRGEPTQFNVGQVIEGWNEALVDMSVGEKRTLIIPPEIGYGTMGYPGVIPPNATLIFEVELLAVN